MTATALVYPAAAGQFAGFVEKLYTDLVLPLAIPVALLSLVVAAIMWIAGNSRGVMRALEILGGVCLVGFGPYIVTTIYATAQNFAK